MENARWTLGFMGGGVQQAIQNKWMFVAGFNTINIFKDIPLGKAYEVHSYIVYWEKEAGWWFFDHTFVCPESGKILANGMTRVMLRDLKTKQRIHMPEYLALMNVSRECPEMPERVKRYHELDDQTRYRMEAWRGNEQVQPSLMEALVSPNPLTAVSPAVVESDPVQQDEHEDQEPSHHDVPFNRYLQENYGAAGYIPPHHECGGGGYGGYGGGGGFGGYSGGYGGFGGGYEDFEGHGYY
ncbi:unnamed protein product [Aphanomyces euteiches]